MRLLNSLPLPVLAFFRGALDSAVAAAGRFATAAAGAGAGAGEEEGAAALAADCAEDGADMGWARDRRFREDEGTEGSASSNSNGLTKRGEIKKRGK
jgi:hypothetical protein